MDEMKEQAGQSTGTNTTPPSASQPEGEDKHDRTINFTKSAISGTEKVVVNSFEKARAVVERTGFDSRSGVRWLSNVLDWDRRILSSDRLEHVVTGFGKVGFYGLVAAQALAVIFCLIAAIKLSSWDYVFYAIGLLILLATLQFTADRFLAADREMIRHSPSRLGSPAFLDCVAVILEIGGIALFIQYIMIAKNQSDWNQVWIGLGLWVFCDAIARMALNPSFVNLSFDEDTRAGDEALGILSFFAKALVRVIPIVFGVAIVIGDIMLAWANVPLIRDMMPYQGIQALWLVGATAALPLISYIFFAFYHLAIDLMRAILDIPRKLDQMNANRKN